ncbi:MAG: hypothetical protein HY226_00940 [Candidatus Vogelbacteria bacterium]|nr:hypothetical protein [Candidatus Vogelbacteria bacterium]
MSQPERTALFYMANLGSEFIRVFNAFDKKNESACRLSAGRCLLIINKLRSLGEMKTREPEVSRLEDILNDILSGNQVYTVTKFQVEKYFNPFALRVAKR